MLTTIFGVYGGQAEFEGVYDASCANDDQFLSPDPQCRVQLRPLLKSDLPPGRPLNGYTALLVIRSDSSPRPSVKVTLRLERHRIVNSRAGVRFAITRLERMAPSITVEMWRLFHRQTAWGVPDPEPIVPEPPEPPRTKPPGAATPKRTRRSQRRNRR